MVVSLLKQSCLLLLSLFLLLTSKAQVQSNLQEKKVSSKSTHSFDSKSIVPQTFHIIGIDTSFYTLDPVNARIIWKKTPSVDSVTLRYRTFPIRLNQTAQKYRYDSVVNILYTGRQITGSLNQKAQPENQDANESIFNFGKIDYNGSFGRSMSVGNSQDAVFNSQFNLQMSGYIGDSIQLMAAISDNNIPIQPDGSTQRLNEFDKILLEFKKKNWQIDIGDVDLRQNHNYYLSFYKRLQGLTYQQQFRISQNIRSKTTFSGAVAKGKFARNVLTVTEGNQGPYLLKGNNNETNFTILAGTEKVFIDGIQVQRGEDQDYTIDYNTAQITFTQKNLISTDKRIQVEFEYSDKNYLNSMIYVDNETEIGRKAKIRVAAYSNGDAKNSPINLTLDDAQKQFLANLGDSTSQAYYPTATRDSFDAAKIMYRKMDTTVNGISYPIYLYSTDANDALYLVSFSYAGSNAGDYVLSSSNANGRVYQWVAPVNGIAQGDYQLGEFLAAPKKQQVWTLGTDYHFDSRNTLIVDVSGSKVDVNTFSSKDKQNDNGLAGKIQYIHQREWSNRQHRKYLLAANASYEWNDGNYQTVERLRAVEYTRDWGLATLSNYTTEKILSAGLSLTDSMKNGWQYNFDHYQRADNGFSGFRNILKENHNLSSGWTLDNQLSYTKYDAQDFNGYFFRPNLTISKIFPHWKNYAAGIGYLTEDNRQRVTGTDSLTSSSYRFQTISAFIKSDAARPNSWSATYYTRTDALPDSSRMARTTRSDNINLSAQWTSNMRHQIRANMTYRSLRVFDTNLSSSTPENTVLGRIEYQINEWKGLLTGNALYEIGSGQEQKREYSYVEVQSGQGQYTWNDYNGDGIAQLNEFELAAFKDQAKYIRIYTTTTQYVKANYTQFNYSLLLNPHIWNEGKKELTGTKKFIARFTLQSSLQANKKGLAGSGNRFNPFQGNLDDTAVIQLSYIWNNVLSFNRNNSAWGLDLSNYRNDTKSLMTYGTEGHKISNWIMKGRWIIARSFRVEYKQTISVNQLSTPSYENRNYYLNNVFCEPTFTYTYNTRFRIMSGYTWAQKKNKAVYGGEKAQNNILTIESKYNTVNSTVLGGKFVFNHISFTGEDANSTVGYQMLEGLLPGKNFQWSLNLTKRLLKNLELTFQYDGRKPASSRTVHLGTATIRAVL